VDQEKAQEEKGHTVSLKLSRDQYMALKELAFRHMRSARGHAMWLILEAISGDEEGDH